MSKPKGKGWVLLGVAGVDYQSNKGAIAHAIDLIRRGVPFVFVPYEPSSKDEVR